MLQSLRTTQTAFLPPIERGFEVRLYGSPSTIDPANDFHGFGAIECATAPAPMIDGGGSTIKLLGRKPFAGATYLKIGADPSEGSSLWGATRTTAIWETVDTNVSAETLKVLDSRTLVALERRRTVLKNLKADWDGCGAAPIEHSLIDELIDDLKLLLAGVDAPCPEIIPGGDGSIQAEWHRNGFVLFYGLDADGEQQFYTCATTAEACSGPDARDAFIAALNVYFGERNGVITRAAVA